MVRRIIDPRFDIYIHLDKKINLSEFEHLGKLAGVFFITNRIEVNWGGYSFVKAITESLREILSSGIEYDYINLLSGQDYPIKSSKKFYEFLAQQNGNSFISYEESTGNKWWSHAVTRYEHYHFTDLKLKGRYLVQKLLNRYTRKRRFPISEKLYGGPDASWWTISTACAQYIVTYLDKNRKLQNFMRFTWGADEFLYTTIIMNSPFKHYSVNNNLRHIEWEEGKSNPKTLDEASFQILKQSTNFFARKFDIDRDSKILSMIDEMVASTNPDITFR